MRVLGVALVASLLGCGASAAEEFGFAFDWGNIPRCTTGNPKSVPSPEFTLSNVPEKTAVIVFHMKDLDYARFDHGGGEIEYAGEQVIKPGAFRYMSPCPPRGSHTYRWTASARDADDNELAEAAAEQDYP